MKQKIITTLFLFIIVACPFSFGAGDDDNKSIYLQVGDEAYRSAVQSGFQAFQGPLYSDPGLPAVVLMSRNRNIALGIGGYVRFTTSVDFGGIMPNIDFIPFLIPITNSKQHSQFNMEAATSRIYLRFLAQTSRGILHFYIDTDFRASSGSQYRFNSIYATLGGFQIGRYWSIMADLDSYPPSVDFQGPNAFVGSTTYQLAYQGKFNKHFSYGIGLEVPSYSIADSLSAYEVPQYIPSVPLYLQYNLSWGHVRAASLLRTLLYKDVVSDRKRYVTTWGAIGSAYLKPFHKTTFYSQIAYGSGIGNYNFELYGTGLDLVLDTDHPGRLRPLRFWGGFIGMKYDFNDFFQMSAVYSRMQILKSDLDDPLMYKIGQYAVFTGYFNVTPRMQFAVEYDYGHLSLRDNQKGHANRLMGLIRYNF